MDIHCYLHNVGDERILQRLSELKTLIAALRQEETKMTQTLDDIKAAVAAETTVVQSAITLIQGLAAALEAAKNDPVKIAGIIDQLNTNDQLLASAVAANTPAV